MAIQTTSTSSSLAPVKKLTTAASSSGSSARSSVSSGSSGSSARSSGSGPPRKRIDNTVYWSIVWRAITPRVGKVLPPLRRLSPE